MRELRHIKQEEGEEFEKPIMVSSPITYLEIVNGALATFFARSIPFNRRNLGSF
jgi:hypothetical protein